MLRDIVVATIAQKLGDREDLTDAIILEMQISQEFRLEQGGRFEPWFLITENATITTTIGEPRVVLPADFVNSVEEEGLWYQDPTSLQWVPITKAQADKSFYYEGEGGAASGPPEKYSQRGERITLYPKPDKVYTLRQRYAAKQPALTTNIENDWLKYAADLLIADVAEALARENMQNEKLAMGFMVSKDAAWTRLLTLHESRQHTNRSYTKGGE